jgi:hypothetical protein
MALKKTIGEFEVKGHGNEGLITVYKNGEIQKAMAVPPGQLDDKFKAVCTSVENYITKNKKQ